MTLAISWWMIPSMITIVGILWAIYGHKDGGSYLSGIGNLLLLIPVLAISLVAWIIAALLKT